MWIFAVDIMRMLRYFSDFKITRLKTSEFHRPFYPRVRFEVLTTKTQMLFFWVLRSHGLVDR